MTFERCVSSAVIWVATAAAASAIAIAQESLVQTFQQTDENGKKQILNEIATRRTKPNINDTVAIIRSGLDDPDARVRETALSAVVSRAGGPRFSNDQATRALWASDREQLQELRSSVLLALRDQDPRIRRAAVLAFGNLDYAASGSQSIGASALRELAAVYERESDGVIRSEIVKAFALSPSDSPVLRQLLRSAFDDLEPGVRQYAAVGASRLKSPELLPQLVRQLNESAVSARLVASGAIAHYGAVALPFLGAIMDAQAQESDPSVKRSLAAAVRAVKAGEKE